LPNGGLQDKLKHLFEILRLLTDEPNSSPDIRDELSAAAGF
jgi:hypothetical protein